MDNTIVGSIRVIPYASNACVKFTNGTKEVSIATEGDGVEGMGWNPMRQSSLMLYKDNKEVTSEVFEHENCIYGPTSADVLKAMKWLEV